MKKIILFFLLIPISFLYAQDLLSSIGEQLIKKDDLLKGKFPLYTENGKWVTANKPNWFAGFTSGELWYMFEMTGREEFKNRAIAHADSLIKFATLDNTHDLGFIFMNSCVKAFEHTGDNKYKNAAISAAKMLMKRFNPNGNFLRAWGKLGTNDREGWMIIDTMMNLELLFWAAQQTGDYSFYETAYKHAVTCMNENVRGDFSSYHVIAFDPVKGNVIKKFTHQGYADETTWARGQAWGIYGFAIAYKFTNDERFFNTAHKMASYFLNKLPQDLIPYWDLNLKGDDVIRDASASAIAASGMLLLSELSQNKNEFEFFSHNAFKIIESLRENYIFTKSKREIEEGILLHTVYNFAKNWGRNESYPAGDFYFLECIRKEFEYSQKKLFIEQSNQRKSYLINDGWFYLEEDIPEFEKLSKALSEWKKINLPHTWNKTDALDEIPGYRRSIGWYQKEIFIPASKSNRKYILHFEGVNNKADIFVNGIKAGSHVGGYVGFDVDITQFVKKGETNILHVKADNSLDIHLIPSQKSDFILYGGITRNVHLNILPTTYVSRMFIQTPIVSAKKAQTKIISEIISDMKSGAVLSAVIKNKLGKVVSSKLIEVELSEGKNEFEINMPEIKNPELWSPDSPVLYCAQLSILIDKNEIDNQVERIGYRWFEFREHGAFYLNGKRLLLRGTHRHEELSGFGNAIPDSLHRKDIQMIKELGANFVRLAHYPQAKEVYRACDELGLLVWDENPWCRGGMGTEIWKENTKRIFSEIITQNYNHPSIILWSIGNESDWLPDFKGGDNPDSLKAFAKTLNDIAKKMDPYRYTTTRKFPAAQNIVDVFSPSIWSGWYSDVYKNYEKAILKARDTYKRFFHAEFGGDSHVGRHSENTIDGDGIIKTQGGDEPINKFRSSSIANIGDWSETYIVDLFDWYLHITENLDWFTGSAQWIFRDFTTPLRPENPIPYVNQKGLVDMNNNPKDAYYVFKSYWSDNPKFCYIESHTWENRNGNTGEKKELNVFSNCKNVELFVNGIGLGKKEKDTKKFPASGLSWQVSFNEGKNIIIANGYDDKKLCASDTLEINYTTKTIGKPEDLRLSYEKNSVGNYEILAEAVDKNGNLCTEFDGRVYFASLSGGKLIDKLGTPVGSSVIEMANGTAKIIAKYIPFQKTIIEVRSQDFKGTYLTIE